MKEKCSYGDSTLVETPSQKALLSQRSSTENEQNELLADYHTENIVLKDAIFQMRCELKQSITSNLQSIEEEEKFIHTVEKKIQELRQVNANQAIKLEKLQSKYDRLLKRYDALRNSKLGRLIFMYWKFRRRLKKRVGR
ncbi:hypothetical protein ACFSTA_08970 [Ornithinibacillus salinisoli]|uniref:Uncharacterized protein n=1 Tax=Ornithinibacillus salinisoli TaxID=1848459 RepID=A0ABW4W0B7_9BACI